MKLSTVPFQFSIIVVVLVIIAIVFLLRRLFFESTEELGPILYKNPTYNYRSFITIFASFAPLVIAIFVYSSNHDEWSGLSVIVALLGVTMAVRKALKRITLYESGFIVFDALFSWFKVETFAWLSQDDNKILVLTINKKYWKYWTSNRVRIKVDDVHYHILYKLLTTHEVEEVKTQVS